MPRAIEREPQSLPPRVIQLSESASGKISFASAVLGVSARQHFDWIVCGHINLLPAAIAAATLSGGRIILLTYGIEVWYKRAWLTRVLMRRVFAVFSISEITLEKMRSWSRIDPSQSFLLPNAIDLARYTPGPKKNELVSRWSLEARRVLLTVGRMDAAEQAKGFDEVIDVLPALLKDMPDIVYIAVGDGSDRERLQAKAAKLELKENVFFPGYVDEQEKLEYYRLADVFVMPSRLEGFGYVFLEALAVGVPVIASKVDGSREAVRDGAWGVLIDPSSPQELVHAIRSVLRHPQIPPRIELDHFSTKQFERRCHAALSVLESRRVSWERGASRASLKGKPGRD